ncbi:Rv3235 family protein [Streptomyces sp. LN785]|uniref:Rv3235 family protein n=1 Tax=Streptomyces sp. LN785 TaxID=3112983 RepID=UPI00371CA02D
MRRTTSSPSWPPGPRSGPAAPARWCASATAPSSAPGVVEACASIAAGEQVRAMAFRLEQGPDLRWRCAAVELGGATSGRPVG